MPRRQRFFLLASLALSGESIYAFAYYLRRDYETTMLEALHISSTELGFASAVYGVVAMLCYFPGGWLADRFSPRWLLASSLSATAAAGALLSLLPSYWGLLGLFVFFAFSSILFFWAALIKATRLLAGDDQGVAFGLLDGGRGAFGALLAVAAVGIFGSVRESVDAVEGFRAVIWMYVVVNCVAAGLVVRLGRDLPTDVRRGRQREPGELGRVLRMPVVWLQALVIFTAYACYLGTYDFATYAQRGFGKDELFGATLSSVNQWIRPVAAIAAGILADRARPSRTVAASFAVCALGFGVLALVPPGPGTLWLLWPSTAVACAAAFALRGVYFALFQEGRIPVRYTGLAVGLVSALGYFGDVVIPPLSGYLKDTFAGGDGHRVLYGVLLAHIAVGTLAALVIPRLGRRMATAEDIVAPCAEAP